MTPEQQVQQLVSQQLELSHCARLGGCVGFNNFMLGHLVAADMHVLQWPPSVLTNVLLHTTFAALLQLQHSSHKQSRPSTIELADIPGSPPAVATVQQSLHDR